MSQLFTLAIVVFADEVFCDELAETEQSRAERAVRLTTDSARQYLFRISDEGNAQCNLLPHLILRWSNPVAGSIHGNVFHWTHEKRPVAVGSFYQWFLPWTHMSHEFHLLSESTVSATYGGVTIWEPKEKGLSFKALRNTPFPRSTPAARLIQMRSIMRDFRCTKTEDEKDGFQQREMRLLPQPVYRYSSGNITDGALFVFVQATDPEVWLLLEAVATNEQTEWRFAAARMNTGGRSH